MNIQAEKEHYFRRKYNTVERFISFFFQIDLPERYLSNGGRVLEIGKGHGIVSGYLKQAGYNITTVDIDPSLEPDIVADVRQLPFGDGEFDAVLVYEVLEHLPFEYFSHSIKEISRVSARYAFMSLPYRSTGFDAVLKFPFSRAICKRAYFHISIRIPRRFQGFAVSGQHYWEMDDHSFRKRKVRNILAENFSIREELSPPLNPYHYFFILEKVNAL